MSSFTKIGAVIIGIGLLGLLFFQPTRQLVAGLLGTNDQPIDRQNLSQLLQQTPLNATTLVGQGGLYYLDAGNLVGTLATERFSAYDDLVDEGHISAGSKLLTDNDQNNP